MKQVLINGCWESPPSGANIQEWLNEKFRLKLTNCFVLQDTYPDSN